MLGLPHTHGCFVCGIDNPRGLHLDLFVDPETGVVVTDFTPTPHDNGFHGITHGGVLATVVDEAMVWAATWASGRFCLCAELTVRYRRPAPAGQPLRIQARVESVRPKLILAVADVLGAEGISATASGKFIPLAIERHRQVMGTIMADEKTMAAAEMLRKRSLEDLAAKN